jgi:hypothetical protein
MKRAIARTTFLVVFAAVLAVFGAAASHAQQNPVNMKASGSERTVPFNVNGSTFGGEEALNGGGSLGQFTYLGLRADSNNVTTTDACPDGDIPVIGGAGIFRFSDGSLMSANITGGEICIDANGIGHLIDTYHVTGGTGRFQKATGELRHTATLNVILSDDSGLPLLLTNTGKFSGTITGVAEDQKAQSQQKLDQEQ